MLSQIEKKIINEISDSNEKSFESLFKTYYSELSLYAIRFLNSIDEAEEIVQDVFYNLWIKRQNIKIDTSVKSYLYQSVKNSCLNFLKHQKVESKYREYLSREIEINETGNNNFTDEETKNQIYEAINKMPPVRKKVFTMCKFDNLKYKEIAEILEISDKTVENHMGKALKFLRDELKHLLPFVIISILQ